MCYSEIEIGETLIDRMSKLVKNSIKNTDKLIEENEGYNTFYFKGIKLVEINLLKDFIRVIRELEEEWKMIQWKIYIKYWKNKELQNLTIIEAVEKILEMEGKNEKEIKKA